MAVRLLYLLTVAHPELWSGQYTPARDTDEGHYHSLAENLALTGRYALAADGPPTAIRPPGVVLPVAVLYRLFGPRPLYGALYTLAASLALVPVAGALALVAGGARRAISLAMVIAALLPTLVFTAAGIWSDPPALLFILLALVPLAAMRDTAGDRAAGYAALAGASLGLGYLNRPSAGILIALVALLLAFYARADWRRPAVFAAAAALPIFAWGVWNLIHLGTFFVGNTQSTVALWQSNNPVTAGLAPPALDRRNGFDLEREAAAGRYLGSWIPLAYIAESDPVQRGELAEMDAQRWLRRQVTGFVRENPRAWLRLVGYKLRRIATAEPTAPSILGEGPKKRLAKRVVVFVERWFLLLAGGAGLVLLARRRHPILPLFLVFLLGGLATVLIAYPNARILMPVSGVLIGPAALALDRLLQTRAWREARKAWTARTFSSEP